MKKIIFILIAMIFLGLTLSMGFSETEDSDIIPNSYIIILKHEENTEEFSIQSRMASVSETQENFIHSLSEEDFNITYKYNSFPMMAVEADETSIERIKKNHNVESVSPNVRVHIMMDDVTEIIESTNYIQYVGYNGTGQTVCVIDTGVDYTHNSLGGEWGEVVIAGAKIVNGFVTTCTEANPTPCKDTHSHGTHVAGTIASQHETYRGVAPGAKIAALNAMPGGGGNLIDIIKSVDWCVENAEEFDITVISMSLGRTGYLTDCVDKCEQENPGFTRAIDDAVDAGIFVTAASGNNPEDENRIGAPACVGNAIAVGGTDKDDNIRYNRGELLDFLAPGVSIRSTVLDNNFGYKSGTSMSTPAVSGAIVLLNENRDLNRTEIIELLNKTKDRIIENEFNYPRINLMHIWEYLNCYCDSCEDCNEKLMDENCTNVFLSENIQAEDTCIFINTSDKIFNCLDKKIGGVGEGFGIYINESNNSEILNCYIKNFTHGIVSNNSTDVFIRNNKIFENVLWDFYLSNNSYIQVENSIIGNSTENATISFEAKDIGLKHSEYIEINEGFSHTTSFVNITNTSEISWTFFNISYEENYIEILEENQIENLKIWKFNETWNPITESGITENYIYSGNVTEFSIFVPKVDTTNPSVILKLNATDLEILEESIKINWTATDNYELDSVLLEIFYPNQTLLFNSTEPIDEVILTPNNLTEFGFYNVTLWANDTTGNQNSTENAFEVSDKIPPQLEINTNQTSPLEFAEDNIKINWTATDNYELDSVLLEIFYPNQTSIFNSTDATGEIILELESLKSWGNYTIELWANDTTGNQNSTNKTFEVVDSKLPEIQFVSPTTEAGAYDQKYIVVNVTTDNTDDLNKTTIYLYEGEDIIKIISTNETKLFHNFTDLPDGIYYLNATVNNTKHGNIRTTETRKIILDTTPPILEIISPKEVTYRERTILINVSAKDEHSEIDRIWYMIEEEDEDDEKNVTYNEPHTFSFSRGTNTLHVWANDTLGHTIHKEISFEVRISSWSGGGHSTPVDQRIEWEDTEDKIETRMKRDDRLTFSVNKREHTLTMRAVYSDRVSMRIRSNVIDVVLNVGETKELDISRNGINDISIYLEKIVGGFAYLSFESLKVRETDEIDEPEEIETIEDVEEEPTETPVIEPPKPIQEPEDREINYFLMGGIIIAIIVIGVLAYIELKKRD